MSNLHLFVEVAIALCTILLAAQVVGNLAKLIAQPRVVGEMIAGVLLGPTLLGRIAPDLSSTLFPAEIMPMLFVICNIGLSMYMFLVGTEINLGLFNRKLMRDAGALSLGAILVPFGAGFLVAGIYGELLNTKQIPYLSFAVFMGTAFAITAFPMLARILQERGIIDTRIGGLAMLSASLQDVVSWILLGLVTSMAVGGSIQGVWLMFLGAIGLVLVLFYVIKPLLHRWIERKGMGEQMDNSLFATTLFLLIACAIFTDHIGLYSVFGGFMLGMAMPRIPTFLNAISLRLKDVTVILFLPVFFAYSGLNTDLASLTSASLLVPTIVIILLAFGSKILPLFSTMRLSGYTVSDSASIAALMNSRGLMELIIANIGMFYGLIDQSLYAILVLIAVTTTLSAMPLYVWSLRLSPAEGSVFRGNPTGDDANRAGAKPIEKLRV
jgi:Kef-type K+ transport system membrane component KefB